MRRRRISQINVVPFIDIVLVLLVIVLATATFVVHNAVPVDLPRSSAKTKIPPKSVSITIDRNGTLYYGTETVSLDGLRRRLEKLDPAKDLVTLQADRSSRFEFFVRVISELKGRGFRKISIVTRGE
ncbi:ExbD/TolR family protein [Nitratifractor sp.]